MTGRLACLVLLAWGALACNSGGQSGTETGDEYPCAKTTATSVGLAEATPAGTPQALFDSVLVPEQAGLRWYSDAARSSYADTTVTLVLVGTPGPARYVVPEDGSCQPRLEVDAVLSFATADGAFAELFSGYAYRYLSGSVGYAGRLPVTDLQGSYDASPFADAFPNPFLELTTALSPAHGRLILNGASTNPSQNVAMPPVRLVAEWYLPDASP